MSYVTSRLKMTSQSRFNVQYYPQKKVSSCTERGHIQLEETFILLKFGFSQRRARGRLPWSAVDYMQCDPYLRRLQPVLPSCETSSRLTWARRLPLLWSWTHPQNLPEWAARSKGCKKDVSGRNTNLSFPSWSEFSRFPSIFLLCIFLSLWKIRSPNIRHIKPTDALEEL